MTVCWFVLSVIHRISKAKPELIRPAQKSARSMEGKHSTLYCLHDLGVNPHIGFYVSWKLIQFCPANLELFTYLNVTQL